MFPVTPAGAGYAKAVEQAVENQRAGIGRTFYLEILKLPGLVVVRLGKHDRILYAFAHEGVYYGARLANAVSRGCLYHQHRIGVFAQAPGYPVVEGKGCQFEELCRGTAGGYFVEVVGCEQRVGIFAPVVFPGFDDVAHSRVGH